jgi:hypothetical protein
MHYQVILDDKVELEFTERSHGGYGLSTKAVLERFMEKLFAEKRLMILKIPQENKASNESN